MIWEIPTKIRTETILLLKKLGYIINSIDDDGKNYGLNVQHPENRQVIFLGDLVDRGPNSPAVLKLVMSMVRNGSALCVPGNHDLKLQKKLKCYVSYAIRDYAKFTDFSDVKDSYILGDNLIVFM